LGEVYQDVAKPPQRQQPSRSALDEHHFVLSTHTRLPLYHTQ